MACIDLYNFPPFPRFPAGVFLEMDSIQRLPPVLCHLLGDRLHSDLCLPAGGGICGAAGPAGAVAGGLSGTASALEESQQQVN